MLDLLDRRAVVTDYQLRSRVLHDMDWYLVYAELRQALTSIRVSERAVAFGERERPDDPQDLILERSHLEESEGATVTNPIGALSPADEGFCHQIVDTFAVVGSTDLSWTEKVCAMTAAFDGSVQLGFGLGKYTNRDVMDAYAGVSRGVEQTTVRTRRRLF